MCHNFTLIYMQPFYYFVGVCLYVILILYLLVSRLHIDSYAVVYQTCQFMIYRKNSKNWDTLNYYRDCPTNGIVGFYSAILRSKDADRITNRVDTDQTAP